MPHSTIWVAIIAIAAVLVLSSSVKLSPKEKKLRDKLEIPLDVQKVCLFGMAAHMDWDWLNWFPTLLTGKNPPDEAGQFSYDPNQSPQFVQRILSLASSLLEKESSYIYSVCEMGFLKGFAEIEPELFDAMKKSGRMRIVGGGITSPDNLLPHGEAFIRNFLLGLEFLDENKIEWTQKVWLPDNFGHDSQLPIVLQAMDAEGVGFARVSGSCLQGPGAVKPGTRTAFDLLLDEKTGGVDFWWEATDGSKVFSHFLEAHYSQGWNIDAISRAYNNVTELRYCDNTYLATSPTEQISSYLRVNQPTAASSTSYVHVSNDFALPKKDLLKYLSDWNTANNDSDTHITMASFSEYADMVVAADEKQPGLLKTRSHHGTSPTTSFVAAPYWMGFYASRMLLKYYHYETSRALMTAEIFERITCKVQSVCYSDALAEGWSQLMPSTHHDYITGTATDWVYKSSYKGKDGEQLALSKTAYNTAKLTLKNVLNSLSNSIRATKGDLLVFNPNGNFSTGIVSMSGDYPGAPKPDQIAANGDRLNLVSNVPSMGWKTLTSTQPTFSGTPVKAYTKDGAQVLENELMVVVLNHTTNGYGIISITDKHDGKEVLGGPSNLISTFSDAGNIYVYGYEGQCNPEFANQKLKSTFSHASITEQGPIRATVSAKQYLFFASGTESKHDLEFSLVAGEPILRISVSGSANAATSVFATFKFANTTSFMGHGTPLHWDMKEAWPYGQGTSFNAVMHATHNYVVAYDKEKKPLGAIYHGGIPAWGVNVVDGNLYGNLMRNNPNSYCDGKGANGGDFDNHTLTYALRIPSSLPSMESGQLLVESKSYHTPLIGLHSNGSTTSTKLPEVFSLVTVEKPAMVTAVKEGSDKSKSILRLYQPTNKPVKVHVDLNPYLWPSKTTQVYLVSAVERPFKNTGVQIINTNVTMQYSLATLMLE